MPATNEHFRLIDTLNTENVLNGKTEGVYATMNTGTLYGVGIGPGDPKLMTFRAAELIRDNEIIALPGEKA